MHSSVEQSAVGAGIFRMMINVTRQSDGGWYEMLRVAGFVGNMASFITAYGGLPLVAALTLLSEGGSMTGRLEVICDGRESIETCIRPNEGQILN